MGSAGAAGSIAGAGGATAGATGTGGRGGRAARRRVQAAAAARRAAPAPRLDGDVIITIKNGGFWNDTSGKRIEAHGAGLIKVGDTWYWIGEDKSRNSGTSRA
jgi:hypothetical protein